MNYEIQQDDNNDIINCIEEEKEQEVLLSLDDYNAEDGPFKYNDITINLYKFIIKNKDRYRFMVKGEHIYLQQKCNKCNKFLNVQILKNNKLSNLSNSGFKPINKDGGGFKVTCNDCLGNHIKPSYINIDKDSLSQLNIRIDSDLKKDLQILSIRKGITLQYLISDVLASYNKQENKMY